MKRDSRFLLFETPTDRYDARGLVIFALLYAGTFLVAAVLGPLILAAVRLAAEGAEPETLLAYLAGKNLDDYVDRVRLICAALLVIWLIRFCRLWGRFGYQWTSDARRGLAAWFGLGAAMLLGVVLMQFLFCDVHWKHAPSGSRIFQAVAEALFVGLLVAFLEEAIFRGMIFRLFYTSMRPWAAVILSALLFAAVHFKKVPVEPDPSWWASFEVAFRSFFGVIFTFECIRFTTLVLAGIALNLIFLRSGSLLPCVGLHAGWVFIRHSWGRLVEVEGSAGITWLGGAGVVDGIFPNILLLALIGFLAHAVYRYYASDPRADVSAPCA